jgi:hypothetical protein
MGNRPQSLIRKIVEEEKGLKVKLAPHRKHSTSPFKKKLLRLFRKIILFILERHETHKCSLWANCTVM